MDNGVICLMYPYQLLGKKINLIFTMYVEHLLTKMEQGYQLEIDKIYSSLLYEKLFVLLGVLLFWPIPLKAKHHQWRIGSHSILQIKHGPSINLQLPLNCHQSHIGFSYQLLENCICFFQNKPSNITLKHQNGWK